MEEIIIRININKWNDYNLRSLLFEVKPKKILYSRSIFYIFCEDKPRSFLNNSYKIIKKIYAKRLQERNFKIINKNYYL